MDVGTIASNFMTESKNNTVEKLIAISATDRETLIAEIKKLNVSWWKEPVFLKINMPCGNIREWLTEDAVPDVSIKCPCNDLPNIKEHWFIRYSKDFNNGN